MKKGIIKLIENYKKHISPVFSFFGIRCKYYPTCSEYTKLSVQKHGVIKGCLLGFLRILRCNPFSKGGYDPIK